MGDNHSWQLKKPDGSNIELEVLEFGDLSTIDEILAPRATGVVAVLRRRPEKIICKTAGVVYF